MMEQEYRIVVQLPGCNRHFIYWKMFENPNFSWMERDTLCRFTGFLDKNGTKIFEHDIIEQWSEGVRGVGEVIQREDGLWIMYPAWQSSIFWKIWPTGHDTKVIGNSFGVD